MPVITLTTQFTIKKINKLFRGLTTDFTDLIKYGRELQKVLFFFSSFSLLPFHFFLLVLPDPLDLYSP